MSGRRSETRRRRRRRRKRILRWAAVLVIIALIAVFLYVSFPLEKVVSSGSRHESPEQITALVTDGPVFDNTLLALLWNRDRNIKSEGFVEKLRAEMTDHRTLLVKVTERRMCGCVLEDGKYWYFDGSGRVQAKKNSLTKGDHIPEIRGLALTKTPEIGQTLPASRRKNLVLLDSLKSLCDLYKVYPDRVTFENSDMTLTIGSIDVKMGDGSNLELRTRTLAGILKAMKNKMSGTLHLEKYDRSSTQAVFDKNEKTA